MSEFSVTDCMSYDAVISSELSLVYKPKKVILDCHFVYYVKKLD